MDDHLILDAWQLEQIARWHHSTRSVLRRMIIPAGVLGRARAVMATYRIFKFDAQDGHALGIPLVIHSETDEPVIEAARQYTDGSIVEVWEGTRLVQRLQPKSWVASGGRPPF